MVDTSQTLFDPWSFAHALVGVIQFGVTQWLFAPVLGIGYLFNVAIHCAWEVLLKRRALLESRL